MSDITTTGNGAAPQPPAVIDQGLSMLFTLITRAAENPDFDSAKFELLLREYRVEKAARAENDYYTALSAAEGEMRAVFRDAANSQTNSRYAKLETISDQIRPIYTAHGFSLTYGTAQPVDPASIRVVCDCAHRGGFVKHYELEAAPDMHGARGQVNKTALHGLGSTITYLRRYLLTMIFDVVLTNEDDDGNKGGGIKNIATGMAENVERRPAPPRPPGRKARDILRDLVRDAAAAMTGEDVDALEESDEARALLRLAEDHPARLLLAEILAEARDRIRAAEADDLDTVMPPDMAPEDADRTHADKLIAAIGNCTDENQIMALLGSMFERNWLERVARPDVRPELHAAVLQARADRIAELNQP